MASSGGVAGVAADLAVEEGVELPDLDALEPWVRSHIPGEDGSLNPLDLTGFVMRDPELLLEMFSGYARADDVDALVLCWWAGEGDEGWAKTLLDPFVAAAADAEVPLIVSPVEATAVGSWTDTYRARGIAFCRGLRSTFRAVRALDRVASAPAPASRVPPPATPTTRTVPALVDSRAGRIARFEDAMARVEAAGIPIAPFVVLGDGVDDDPALAALGPRLAVKLADVPHRTELGAVRLDVTPEGVRAAARELREVALRHGVPSTVAVQPMVAGYGEAFIGVQARSDLGAILLFGRGGILLELAAKVDGRLLPLEPGAAEALVGEVVTGVGALRGQRPWEAEPLVRVVEAAGALWQANHDWLASMDLNPLVLTDDGVVAVDALLVADQPDGSV
jgi:acyl-CoA synthetase (NDP forming)